jgi:type IV secretory pathway VirB4 component
MKWRRDNSLCSEVPYRTFLQPSVVDLKGRGLAKGYQFIGPSPEISNLDDLIERSRQFAAAMVHLGTGDSIQAIYHRVPAPLPPAHTYPSRAPALVEAERRAQFIHESHWLTPSYLYLIHQHESVARNLLEAILNSSDMPNEIARKELSEDYAIQRFSAFEDATSSAVGLIPLPNEQMFRDLLMNVTYLEHAAAMPDPGVRLDQVIGSCARQINGRAPMMGDYHLKVVTLRLYPGVTFPQILAVLLKLPGRMTVSARFMCLDSFHTQQAMETEKAHWNRTGFESFQKLLAKFNLAKHDTDRHAEEMKADIGDAIADAAGGTAYGWCKVTVIIRDEDKERAAFRAHNIIKECYAMGITAGLETLHTTTAVMESWPGYVLPDARIKAIKIRTPLISGRNFADMLLPATHWEGMPYVDSELYPPQTPTPLVVGGGSYGQPFHWPIAIDGNPHQLFVGPTRTGKSSFLSVLACAYLSIPDSKIAWLDVDRSSFVLSQLLGADYREVGDPDSPALCPLAMLDQPDGLDWLEGFFERLFLRWKLELDEQQAEEFSYRLREARRLGIRTISGLYATIPGEQKRIRRILKRYTRESWGAIFNGEPSADSDNRVAIFEMRRLKAFPKAASGPATELILRTIINRLKGTPSIIIADEFWSLLLDEISADWMFDTLRTLGKLNAGFIGATQSLTEIANSPQRDFLLENFGAKIFLPNHAANGEFVRGLYRSIGLDDNKIACIAGARSRAEYFFDCAHGSRKFSVELGQVGRSICAATSYSDVQAARRVLAESTPELFLDNWLTLRAPGWESYASVPATAETSTGW